MASSRALLLFSTRHDTLLHELRDWTGAADIRLVKTLDLVYAEHHILSATFGLGGKQIRYFYRVAVANGRWTRFNFEGSIKDFFKWFALSAYNTPELWKVRKDLASNKLPCVRDELYLRRRHAHGEGGQAANGIPAPSSAYTKISSSYDALQSSELHFLHLPREMRDLSYEWLLPDTYAVYVLGPDSAPLLTAFATSSALSSTSRQLRTEFRDHLCRNKSQMRAIILATVDASTDLSDLLPKARAKDVLCLECKTHPPWVQLRAFLEELDTVPETRQPHVTFVFRTTVARPRAGRSVQESLMYSYRDRKRLRFVFKQEFRHSNGSTSGLTMYKTDYPCSGTPQCLRSDDMPGYISLLLDFEKPCRGRDVVEKLCWDMCCFADISENEKQALDEALPPVNANEYGLWIVRDKDVGGPETGST